MADIELKPKPAREKQSQEAAWAKVARRVENFAANRPDDETGTLLAHLRELNISRPNPNQFYRNKPALADFANNYFVGQGCALDDNFFCPTVGNGTYTMRTMSPAQYMMQHVRPETEAIVELGSGWSFNLFQIYVGLGRTRCKTVDFIGAEFTAGGRDCARKIAEFDGNIRYTDQHMDYRQPEIGFLKDYKKHILVFTHHSIEQVDRIDPQLYQDLSDLNAQVTLMHFEPIGWQRDETLLKARTEDDTDFFQSLKAALPTALKTRQDQLNNAAWWSWRGRYNINLTSITNRYEKSGHVDVKRRAYDFSVAGNVLNPTTLYHMDFVK